MDEAHRWEVSLGRRTRRCHTKETDRDTLQICPLTSISLPVLQHGLRSLGQHLVTEGVRLPFLCCRNEVRRELNVQLFLVAVVMGVTSSTWLLIKTSSRLLRESAGSSSPMCRGSSRYNKLWATPYMNWKRRCARTTRYSNSWRVIMLLDMTFLYSSGRLWKSGITSEMGTLSDWYLMIRASIRVRMARALCRLFTNVSSVTISLIFDLSLFWGDVLCTKSQVVTMTCRCRSDSNKVWHMAWIVP
jgi:hypothetical protein